MLRSILEKGCRASVDGPGITPGGVLLYGDAAEDVATVPFGRSHLVPAETAFPVATDTIYDIASLTKPVATAATFMKLDIDPDTPVISLVPEFRVPGAERVTFAHLLGHTSGFPAHLKFYERLLAGERLGRQSARQALFSMVLSTELTAAPGTRELYSDLGYITLGLAIERAAGARLDAAFFALVAEPLGLTDTFYIDLEDESDGPNPDPVPRARIAPTEVCPYRGLVHAAVHDDNAHAGGGIFGHAGLFATAADVGRFARAMIQLLDGHAVAGFSPDIARRFATTTAAPGALRTLGWDRPSPGPGVTHTGTLWPRTSIGHLGFTGTSLWLDPARGRYVVLLTNRVHPSRDIEGIREFRGAVMDAVVRTLDASC